MNELNFQKEVIVTIVNNSENNIDALAEYIIQEKKNTAKILHFIYGVIIVLLLIILNQN